MAADPKPSSSSAPPPPSSAPETCPEQSTPSRSDHVSEEAILEIRQQYDRLRGKMFGLIESWGRPERQERAMKGLIRHLTYDGQAELEAILRRDEEK